MDKRILVAYVSRCGSTAEVADAIGQVFCTAGATVDVRPAKQARDVGAYDAVILGSAARMGKLLPGAAHFAQRNQRALQSVPVAYFFVGMTMMEDTPEHRAEAAAYLDPLREVAQPVSVGLFGGKVDFDTLSPVMRSMLSMGEGVPEGDWRDWEAIRAWAEELVPQLSA